MNLLPSSRKILLYGASLFCAGAGSGPAATLLADGTFDSAGSDWTRLGGAAVITTGELLDNPYARVPDGPLVMLYQIAGVTAPRLSVTFDFFTGLMNPLFPSPGGFPDTAFATVYFGESRAALQPDAFAAGATRELFDYDAAKGLRGQPAGSVIAPSPVRPGWQRFSLTLAVPDGQPWFSLTFQNLNANGTPGDSALLVDNVDVLAIPEPSAALLAAAGLLALLRRPSRLS